MNIKFGLLGDQTLYLRANRKHVRDFDSAIAPARIGDNYFSVSEMGLSPVSFIKFAEVGGDRHRGNDYILLISSFDGPGKASVLVKKSYADSLFEASRYFLNPYESIDQISFHGEQPPEEILPYIKDALELRGRRRNAPSDSFQAIG